LCLQGCVFSGYGVDYDSGVWLRMEKKDIIFEATLDSSEKVSEVINAWSNLE
jgi:hypothetical protein